LVSKRLANGWPCFEEKVTPPDYSDVQGLARFGYSKLTEASFLVLRIRDAGAARAWIASAPVSTAETRATAPDTALQIGFTSAGLRALGIPESTIAGFSTEFIDGMATDAGRSRRLGDIGSNDPACWFWGGQNNSPDLVVMVYARQNLDAWQQEIQKDPWNEAFEIVTTLPTSDMGGHEPFGFTDGISQPAFDWNREHVAVGTTVDYNNRVALGELLLGYPNEYGQYTDRPLLDAAADPAGELLPAEDSPARKDLGRNGTYLVLRQLGQDVRGFWQYLARAANGDTQTRYRLGAAMVGRTVDGEPLIPAAGQTVAGITDQPGTPRNAFTYDGDPAGTQCPFGAHIRRANPRNADLFGHPSGLIGKVGNKL
jgi:hypothetical protein